jgi:hypothetical protein
MNSRSSKRKVNDSDNFKQKKTKVNNVKNNQIYNPYLPPVDIDISAAALGPYGYFHGERISFIDKWNSDKLTFLTVLGLTHDVKDQYGQVITPGNIWFKTEEDKVEAFPILLNDDAVISLNIKLDRSSINRRDRDKWMLMCQTKSTTVTTLTECMDQMNIRQSQ